MRDSDLTARPGGDEFIFIARDAEFDALPVANRLLQAWRESGPGRSFSAGIAIHDSNDLPEQTLENADQAVLRAKREGKNRVCLSPKGGWLGDDDDGDDGDCGGEPGGVPASPPPVPLAPPSFVSKGLPSVLDDPPLAPAPKNLDFLPTDRQADDRRR